MFIKVKSNTKIMYCTNIYEKTNSMKIKFEEDEEYDSKSYLRLCIF